MASMCQEWNGQPAQGESGLAVRRVGHQQDEAEAAGAGPLNARNGSSHQTSAISDKIAQSGHCIVMPLPPTPPPSSFIEYFWLLSLPFTLLAMSAIRR